MSTTKQTLIYCDGGDECPRWQEEDIPYTVDGASDNAATQRASYGKSGWLYRNGKDYCPACAKRLFDIGNRQE